MATNIFIKRSSVPGKKPTTSDLAAGELGLNMRDAKLFAANSSAVFEIGSNVSSIHTGSLTIGNGSPYTFPTSDGSADQYLKTDGSGTLTFATVVAGASGTNNTIDTFLFTPTANQTIFTGTANVGGTLAYTNTFSEVYLNGVKLIFGRDYSTPNTSHFILTSNAVSGDTVELVGYNGTYAAIPSTYYDSFTFTSNTDQTQFNGTDDNGKTLNYSLTATDVYLNGVKQVKGVDWFANTISKITLSIGTANNDVLDVVTFNGISSPSEYLEVANVAAYLTPYIEVANASATYATINDATFTGNTSFNDGELFVDAANDRVGIGTSSPSSKFDVRTVAGTSAQMNLYSGNSTTASKFSVGQIGSIDWDVGITATIGDFKIGGLGGSMAEAYKIVRSGTAVSYQTWSTSGTERMRVDSSGNIGIGTSSPAGRFHVRHDVVTGKHIFQSTDQRLTLGTYWESGIGQYSFINSSSDSENVAQALLLMTGNTEHMRITSTGLVGIGTSSPSCELTVSSGASSAAVHTYTQLEIESSSHSALQFSGSTGAEQWIWFADDASATPVGGITYYHGGPYMGFRVEGSERARIDSSGNFLAGRTTTTFGNQGHVLLENGAVYHERSVTGQSIMYLNRLTTDGEAVAFYRAGSQVGDISVTASSTAYNTSSDYRLKENVVTITDGIERLKQLKPSRFNFIVDPNKEVDGFLAHEAATVVPEAVTGEKDAVDEDGNPEYQGIDQSKLVPLLTAALQEAIAKIETLEARVATLEGN